MNPRLVAISGPREGQTFALEKDRFTVGRHQDNDLGLPRIEVSRQHCELTRDEDGGFTVHDLESRHGTFVNSRPIRRRRLVHSDLLTVGDTALLYLLDDSSVVDAGAASSDSGLIAASTVWKSPEDVLYLDAAKVDAALPEQARIARDLNVLLKISTALQESRGVDSLAGRLLELVFETVPAERGAVLLREGGVAELGRAALLVRGEASGVFRPRRAVVDQVLAGGRGLACDDAGDAAETGARSVLCVPLLGRDEELGVLYLDGRSGAFTEHHLELLTAVAGVAALAFENAYHVRWLQRENRRLRDDQLEHDIVGESAAITEALELIRRVAPVDSTVLIRGESGTGKELAAQAIHRSSPRAEGPFVAVNCATLSETLLESELFGHEKGAFTGATSRRVGKLEAAHRGTLFLDEVGEIPPGLQAKLLRALQERVVERLGGTRPVPVDVRIVAATNRDLEAMIRGGTFRDDLYYRLKVIAFEMPALRDRRDDVPLLASHFAALHGRRFRRRVLGIAPAARKALLAYDWPGNVRELANAIERAVVLGQDEVVRPEDLPGEVLEVASSRAAAGAATDFQTALAEAKRRLIRDAFARTDGDHAGAAELLGVHVNSLHRMVRNLGLKAELSR